MTEFVKCDCYAHACEVSVEDGLVEVCMWSIGHDPQTRTTLGERIRWAWHDLFGGRPWSDEMVLSPGSARRLADVLNRAADEAESQVKSSTVEGTK